MYIEISESRARFARAQLLRILRISTNPGSGQTLVRRRPAYLCGRQWQGANFSTPKARLPSRAATAAWLILDLEPEPRFHIDTQGPILSKIGRLSFESEIRAVMGSAPNSATRWIPLVVRMLESLANMWGGGRPSVPPTPWHSLQNTRRFNNSTLVR